MNSQNYLRLPSNMPKSSNGAEQASRRATLGPTPTPPQRILWRRERASRRRYAATTNSLIASGPITPRPCTTLRPRPELMLACTSYARLTRTSGSRCPSRRICAQVHACSTSSTRPCASTRDVIFAVVARDEPELQGAGHESPKTVFADVFHECRAGCQRRGPALTQPARGPRACDGARDVRRVSIETKLPHGGLQGLLGPGPVHEALVVPLPPPPDLQCTTARRPSSFSRCCCGARLFFYGGGVARGRDLGQMMMSRRGMVADLEPTSTSRAVCFFDHATADKRRAGRKFGPVLSVHLGMGGMTVVALGSPPPWHPALFRLTPGDDRTIPFEIIANTPVLRLYGDQPLRLFECGWWAPVKMAVPVVTR